jgi:hypothetical protein
MGTTTLAICVALVLYFIRTVYKHGLLFVREHLKQTLGEGALWAVGAWLALFAFNTVRKIYNDHQQLVQKIQEMKIAAANAAKPAPLRLVGLGYACEVANIPRQVLPNETLWLLPISAGGIGGQEGLISGFRETKNEGNKPIAPINQYRLKEVRTWQDKTDSLGAMSSHRCEVRNLGGQVFSNIEINLTFAFLSIETSGAVLQNLCVRPYMIIIPEIDPGKSFVFYAVNYTDASVNFSFPEVASLELPDTTRQTVGLRQVGAGAEQLLFIPATKVRWNGPKFPPEDKYTCTKLAVQRKQ